MVAQLVHAAWLHDSEIHHPKLAPRFLGLSPSRIKSKSRSFDFAQDDNHRIVRTRGTLPTLSSRAPAEGSAVLWWGKLQLAAGFSPPTELLLAPAQPSRDNVRERAPLRLITPA